ncbi:hypothetical protein ACRALDRAFT_210585 [Sodiomyces alcalophilus JCM 7366]|uniref:uncharacterized protein n=1 Tax=Sodiomyces alcalophilus JCM 7366 TaxID=591952 RepID=UPI0039B600FA
MVHDTDTLRTIHRLTSLSSPTVGNIPTMPDSCFCHLAIEHGAFLFFINPSPYFVLRTSYLRREMAPLSIVSTALSPYLQAYRLAPNPTWHGLVVIRSGPINTLSPVRTLDDPERDSNANKAKRHPSRLAPVRKDIARLIHLNFPPPAQPAAIADNLGVKDSAPCAAVANSATTRCHPVSAAKRAKDPAQHPLATIAHCLPPDPYRRSWLLLIHLESMGLDTGKNAHQLYCLNLQQANNGARASPVPLCFVPLSTSLFRSPLVCFGVYYFRPLVNGANILASTRLQRSDAYMDQDTMSGQDNFIQPTNE